MRLSRLTVVWGIVLSMPRFVLALYPATPFLVATTHAQPNTLSALKRGIETVVDSVEGEFAVAFRHVDAPNQELLIDENVIYHAASTMKTPVLVELYRQAYEGTVDLDDSIRVENQFRSIVDGSSYSLDPEEDSEKTLYGQIGEKRSIRTLMRTMIVASSNLATNILIEKVGPDNVTQTMRRYGADSIQVLRGVEDRKAYQLGLNNVTSAHDLLVVFERIARGTAVSEEASREMIQILEEQQFDDMIPGRLPDSVEVAHKTGWITGLRHDSGIVVVPDGPTYVLVLLSQNLEDEEKGKEALATISRKVFDCVTR